MLFPEVLIWAEAEDAAIEAFIEATAGLIEKIAADPDSFVTDELTKVELLEEVRAAVAPLEEARAELASRAIEEPVEEVDEEAVEDIDAELTELALAARSEEDPEPEDESDPEPEAEPAAEAAVEVEAVEPEPVVAAAAERPRKVLARPARSKASTPTATPQGRLPVSLTAASGAPGYKLGEDIDPIEVASAMIKRRNQFGVIAEGTSGEQVPIARMGWEYPNDRVLNDDIGSNMGKVDVVVDPELIKWNFAKRRESALTAAINQSVHPHGGAVAAAGGLCAPLTPMYNLAMLSVADRPVRGALPSFGADRGGIRMATPATIAAIDDAVGIRTVEEDYAGGTEGAKTCQVIDCPPFSDCDVDIIFHCLQFGNLGARAFPELVAQWNNLVLAAQARAAETNLLDGIEAASTQVTAATIGLGASATFLGEVAVAAAAMRNRHRMDPETVLRFMAPRWLLELLVSDTQRTSVSSRFDMNIAAFIGQLRALNVEPTFYIDGATGHGQVFGAQGAGALTVFPSTTTWYLYPEGSFLFLDGGTLELGLVRDSVLNASNDFQLFGESFEGICFVGIESLAVTSAICDSGTLTLPVAVTCPIDYAA